MSLKTDTLEALVAGAFAGDAFELGAAMIDALDAELEAPVREKPEGALLRPREAAELLSVSLTTFFDVVRPRVPVVKIGRRSMQKDGSFASLPATSSTRSGSGTTASGSSDPRAKEILAWLRKKPRRSTRK